MDLSWGKLKIRIISYDCRHASFDKSSICDAGLVGAKSDRVLASPHSDLRFTKIPRDLRLVDYFPKSANRGEFCKPVGKDDFECH